MSRAFLYHKIGFLASDFFDLPPLSLVSILQVNSHPHRQQAVCLCKDTLVLTIVKELLIISLGGRVIPPLPPHVLLFLSPVAE